MSLFVAKYLPRYGWCAAKNFDFGFKPNLILRRSFRWNTERLYVWDSLSKYSEGINEHKIGIFSSNITLPNDLVQGKLEATKEQKSKAKSKKFASGDGLLVRKALSENSVQKTINKLIELQVVGCTIVFDVNTCILLEAGYIKDDQSLEEKYVYETKYVSQNETIIRGNYGVLLPWLGYSSSVESERPLREECERKIERISTELYTAGTPMEILDTISSPEILKNSSLSKNRTSFQILIKPGETCLHARAINCSFSANINRLNQTCGKTVFEISSFKKMSFMEHMSLKSLLR